MVGRQQRRGAHGSLGAPGPASVLGRGDGEGGAVGGRALVIEAGQDGFEGGCRSVAPVTRAVRRSCQPGGADGIHGAGWNGR